MDLRTWLKMKGIMQKDFAQAMGIKPSSLSLILQGKIRPRLPVALRIEEYTQGEVSRIDLLYPQETSAREDAHLGTVLTHAAREELLKRHGLR